MRKIYPILSIILIFMLSGCNNNQPSSPIATDNPISSTVNASSIEIPVEKIDNSSISENSYIEEKSNVEKRIICWGTSLTEGTGGDGVSMPSTLEELSGATVLNYGGYAERTNCIASRSGASKLILTDNITIPSSSDIPIEINFYSEFGDCSRLLLYTDSGLNPVTMDGIVGNLSRVDDENYNRYFYFTRLDSGEEKQISAETIIVPYSANDIRDDDICIFESGGNDELQSTDDILVLIDKIDKMIAFSGSDKYLVVSELNSHERVPVTDEVNSMFEDHYKEHFINFRKYLIEEAFSDLDISPSDEDKEDINNYEIPRYFRVDDVHGNSLYYTLFGQQVYKKCHELGYLE